MGCMKSTPSESPNGGVQRKIAEQPVRTDNTHYVRDPTSKTKNNIRADRRTSDSRWRSLKARRGAIHSNDSPDSSVSTSQSFLSPINPRGHEVAFGGATVRN
ncbi:hypothetical protein JOQ06_008163, partial [Pogonophryne albipinna]